MDRVTSEEEDESVQEINAGEVQALLGLDQFDSLLRLWVHPGLRGVQESRSIIADARAYLSAKYGMK